jgi:hypothetical protein
MTQDGLDGLRCKAEQEAVREDLSRRRTWAPPLIIEGEMLALLRELGWLGAEDKPVGRLWALWTDPERGPITCKGFELIPRQEHKGTRLFRAMYAEREREIAHYQGRLDSMENKLKATPDSDPQKKYFRDFADFCRRKLDELSQQGSDWRVGTGWRFHNRETQNKYMRVQELALARVMDFCGDPDGQRKAGGQLTGNCCICGKTLTDPQSIEYGIGPECRSDLKAARNGNLISEPTVYGTTRWRQKTKEEKQQALERRRRAETEKANRLVTEMSVVKTIRSLRDLEFKPTAVRYATGRSGEWREREEQHAVIFRSEGRELPVTYVRANSYGFAYVDQAWLALLKVCPHAQHKHVFEMVFREQGKRTHYRHADAWPAFLIVGWGWREIEPTDYSGGSILWHDSDALEAHWREMRRLWYGAFPELLTAVETIEAAIAGFRQKQIDEKRLPQLTNSALNDELSELEFLAGSNPPI